MDSLQFIFWLQGFFEISNPKELTSDQIQVIRDHLQLVLTKVTPNRTLEPFPNFPGIDLTPPYGLPNVPYSPFIIPNPLTPPYTVECSSSNSTGMDPNLIASIKN